MAAGLSEHSLWQTGCAAGIDDVDGICGFDGHTLSPAAAGAGAFDQVLPLSLSVPLADGAPWQLVTLPVSCQSLQPVVRQGVIYQIIVFDGFHGEIWIASSTNPR